MITYSTVSFFEIETLLLNITALHAESIIDASIAITTVFRILNFIRLQGWFNSPCPSYEHFIRAVRANKLNLPSLDLAIFTIRVTNVCKFQARVVAYSLDH